MAAFLTNAGKALVADVFCKRDLTNRPADMELGLFTNSSVDADTDFGTLTEPVGAGYARVPLVDSEWTGTDDTRAQALVRFTAGVGGWVGDVRGGFIATTGGAARVVVIGTAAAQPMNENDTFDVTPSMLFR